jgi:hypothetical protein
MATSFSAYKTLVRRIAKKLALFRVIGGIR